MVLLWELSLFQSQLKNLPSLLLIKAGEGRKNSTISRKTRKPSCGPLTKARHPAEEMCGLDSLQKLYLFPKPTSSTKQKIVVIKLVQVRTTSHHLRQDRYKC